MSDIADFVTARLSEDEAVMRGEPVPYEPNRDLWVGSDRQLAISRQRLQVELEAKRRLIALARATGDDHILRVLAMVYDDHAEWRHDWDVLDAPNDDWAAVHVPKD